MPNSGGFKQPRGDSLGLSYPAHCGERQVSDAGKEAVLAEYPMGKRMVPGPEARSRRRDLTGLMQPCGDPYAEHRALDDAWLHSTWTEGDQMLKSPFLTRASNDPSIGGEVTAEMRTSCT